MATRKTKRPPPRTDIPTLDNSEEVMVVKLEVPKSELIQFLQYFEANKDKFLVEKTKDTLKIEYTDIHFSPELILIFNSVKIPFDLIYFKHIIFHKFEKTIDVTFDTHTRCDKEVSTDICNYIFYKLEI